MSFGKNRVQYNEFVWSYYRYELYYVYFNEDGLNLANYTANYAERAITEIEDFFEKSKKLYFTQEEFIALFKDYPLDFEPGEKFNYTNSGYYLLGVIIERVSGKSYEDFIEENILKPLNMKDSAIYNEKNIVYNRANGYELNGDKLINDSYSEWSKFAPTGGLISTVEDILKWDNTLYSELLVSNKTLAKIFTDYSDGYGYGWSIGEKFGSKMIGHNGAHNGYISQIYRYPQEKICIILLCNHRFINVWDICDNISSIALGNNVELPKRPDIIEIDAKLYSEYVGEYDEPDDEDFVFTVSHVNKKTFLKF